MKSRLILLAVLLSTLAVLIPVSQTLAHRGEPKYAGRRISEYVADISQIELGISNDRRWQAYQNATNGLQQIGPLAAKWLAEHLEQTNAPSGPFHRLIERLPAGIQSKIWINRGMPHEFFESKILHALNATGPLAIPVLTNYLDSTKYDAQVRQEIYREISSLPLRLCAQPATPILECNAHLTNDMDRAYASFALLQIAPAQHDFAVSNLISVLIRTNSSYRTGAAMLIRQLNPMPPECAAALQRTNPPDA